MIGALLALYPAAWRRRYGEEFRAVLESRPLGPFDVADVLLGALDARMALRFAGMSDTSGGHQTMLRLGGYGAISGGILWVVGVALASATEASTDWLLVVIIGTLGLLLAITGLSAFQAHRAPRLAWAAFGIPAVGSIVSIVGLGAMVMLGDRPFVGGLSAWNVWILGLLAMIVGSALFAIATIRAAVLTKAGAVALLIASVSMLVGMLVSMLGGVDTAVGQLAISGTMMAFGGSWVALGVSALRRGPIRAVAPA